MRPWWRPCGRRRFEGDEANARYWYRLAGREFPGMDAIDAEIAALKADLGNAG